MSSTPNLVADIQEQSRCWPDRPALVWHGESTSYAQLDAMACAARPAVDAAPPGPLGIRAVKSPAAIALILACLQAGRSFLLPSPSLPPAILDTLFDQAGCVRVLSVDEPSAGPERSAGTAAQAPALPADAVGATPAAAAPIEPDPQRVSFMLTTSGSTGLPKIVPLTTGAVDLHTAWAHQRFDLGAGRVVLNYAPLNFDVSLLDVWATLRYGGCVVLVDALQATRGGALLELLAEHGVQVVQAVPMLFELMLATGQAPDPRLGSVEHILITGEAIRPGCLAALPDVFPNARFYNLYGCTETNDSFLYEIALPREPPDRLPLGDPLDGVQARLIGEDGRELAGPGIGELHVSTPFQTTGYLPAQAGSPKFLADPPQAGGRVFFRSGDLVQRDIGGVLTLVGRNDFQVKVRGQRINIQEVERVLLSHQDVLEAAVVTVPDPQSGLRLKGVVRRRAGSTLNGLHLRQHCAERLLLAAVPTSLRITDHALPATATGKVDRARLRETETGGA